MSFTANVCVLLSEWITFLLGAVPLRSRLTFVELLCGCLMSQEGWVTQAISINGREKHWTTYYKLLKRGSIKTQALASQLMRLVVRLFPPDAVTGILDDTLLPRQSATAPGVPSVMSIAARTTGPGLSTRSAGSLSPPSFRAASCQSAPAWCR